MAILHSALGAGERFDEWRRAGRGDAQIVVGARSAVFAPVRELGLVIIDEEHDGSYKQDKAPRYHAREVALKRAQHEGAVVVLGSATPSLESYSKATRGEYRHVRMEKRATGRPLPEVEIVDMTNEARSGSLPVLSRRLCDDMCDVLARQEQVILFLNRRGFATYVQCLGCGHVEKCPNCDVSLTHHKIEGTLRCHHCDWIVPVPGHCPKCDGWMLSFSGSGTEKVQAEVEKPAQRTRFGRASSVTPRPRYYDDEGLALPHSGRFSGGESQCAHRDANGDEGARLSARDARGRHSADTALNVPDFRASERTFQLLAQVAGACRARADAGPGVGANPGRRRYCHYYCRAPRFWGVCGARTRRSRSHSQPAVFTRRHIISSHEDETTARFKLEKLAAKLNDAIAREKGGTDLLGPVSCPLARVKNKFRFHLLLRDKSRPRLHRILKVYDDLDREGKEGLDS